MFVKTKLLPLAAAALMFTLSALPASAGPLSAVKGGYTASGSATISSGKVKLGSDFQFSGGPDVYVAVQQDGEIKLLGKLKSNSGAQSYKLPSGDDGSGAQEILLYCKKFSVTLGSAPIN